MAKAGECKEDISKTISLLQNAEHNSVDNVEELQLQETG